MHMPRIGAAIRSFGNEGARDNAGNASATRAADRAAVERLAARIASKESRSA